MTHKLMCRSNLPKEKKKSAKKSMSRKPKRQTLKAKFSDEKGRRKESGLERKFREFLQSTGIYFIQEKYLEWNGHARAFDFYITTGASCTFAVEIHGERFHHDADSSDQMCPSRLQKSFRNDTLKQRICKELGIPLVTIWEDQMKNDFDSVKKMILQRIKKAV